MASKIPGVAHHPGHRQPRRHGTTVGPSHPPADRRSPHRPHLRGQLAGVQPGRHHPGHRRRGWHGTTVGPSYPPADRRSPHRPRRPGHVGGVQPGRQDPGQRQPLRHSAVAGRGLPGQHRGRSVCLGREVPDKRPVGRRCWAGPGIPKRLPLSSSQQPHDHQRGPALRQQRQTSHQLFRRGPTG
jgi:hypothetical protein